uniref:Uncharacterized protein n=1 Tax=Schizaphis graminum TaxID=13262 RepID=A0A2S2N6K4_SCHGA
MRVSPTYLYTFLLDQNSRMTPLVAFPTRFPVRTQASAAAATHLYLYTARPAVPRSRAHGVTIYYNDICSVDAATTAALSPATPSTAAETAIVAVNATAVTAAATSDDAPADLHSPDDGLPRRRLIVPIFNGR